MIPLAYASCINTASLGLIAAGRERSTLAMVQSRYALWDPLLALDPSDLDYRNDGVMIPPGTQQFSDAVYHYVRALAHAAKAAQATDGKGQDKEHAYGTMVEVVGEVFTVSVLVGPQHEPEHHHCTFEAARSQQLP